MASPFECSKHIQRYNSKSIVHKLSKHLVMLGALPPNGSCLLFALHYHEQLVILNSCW